MAAKAEHEFTFELRMVGRLAVPADTYEEAVERLKDLFAPASVNYGAWPGGDPVLGEIDLLGDVSKDDLMEVDGEQAEVCRGCGAIEGLPDWGTVGDGFDGFCGSCADKREPADELP